MTYPNIYPRGQCTWGAANLANWVLQYGNLEDAKDWAANWRAHGGFVQNTPAVGSIACFQPGDNDADLVFGHVAYVISVGSSGAFVVDEMNGPKGPGHYDDRLCHNDPGVSFLMPFPPTPPPTHEDDMNIFQVNPSADPNARLPISGPTGASELNLVAYSDTTATVFAYDVTGKPLGTKAIALKGNDPGISGPVPVYGTVAGLLGLTTNGPVTLVFYPATVPYTVTVH